MRRARSGVVVSCSRVGPRERARSCTTLVTARDRQTRRAGHAESCLKVPRTSRRRGTTLPAVNGDGSVRATAVGPARAAELAHAPAAGRRARAAEAVGHAVAGVLRPFGMTHAGVAAGQAMPRPRAGAPFLPGRAVAAFDPGHAGAYPRPARGPAGLGLLRRRARLEGSLQSRLVAPRFPRGGPAAAAAHGDHHDDRRPAESTP